MQGIVNGSALVKQYNAEVDRESAYEMLSKKLESAAKEAEREKALKEAEKQQKLEERERKVKEKTTRGTKEKPLIDRTTQHQITRTVFKVLERGLLGILTKR